MPGYVRCSRFAPKNRKYFFSWLTIIWLSFPLLGIYHSSIAQRAKIDSLREVLSTAIDTTRVDCLNWLSLSYTYLQVDTAESYAQKALEEATALHYTRGLVIALNNQARIAGHSRHDFVRQEKISIETIKHFPEIKDKKVLSDAYMNLALSLFCQSLFDRSERACQKIIQNFEQTGDKKSLGEAIALLGSIKFETGNYEESFANFNKSLDVFQSVPDSYNTSIVLVKIGDLYRLAGDPKTADNYYFQSLQYAKGPALEWHPLVDLGDTFYALKQSDSPLREEEKYFQTIKSLTIKSNYLSYPRLRQAETHLSSGEYDKALILLHEELKTSERTNDKNYLMRLLLDIANAYEAKKEYQQAIDYARNLIENAKVHKAKQYTRDGYMLMFKAYDQLHELKDAYFFYRQYTSMKDSISLDDFVKRVAIYKAATENEKKQAQIELLSREKLINQQQLKISEHQLSEESTLKYFFIGGIVFLVLLGVIVYRNVTLKQKNESNRRLMVEQELEMQKLESDRVKSEMEQQASELEMQALRAQMNPHFIFNSLNSINRFILQNNALQASEYLTKFSKLVRLILSNSQASLIPLDSELESLQLYLQLEALRFDNHFEYMVNVEEGLDSYAMKVPPLIIQPYAENAIWHGMMHKEERGHLTIEIFIQSELLCCKISDDGIGRARATELRSKSAASHKSMGMRITEKRIAILQQRKSSDTSITITDLTLADGSPGGTEVFLKLPVQYD